MKNLLYQSFVYVMPLIIPVLYSEIFIRKASPIYYKKVSAQKINLVAESIYIFSGTMIRWLVLIQTVAFIVLKYTSLECFSMKETILYLSFGLFIGILIERCFTIPKWSKGKPKQSIWQIMKYVFFIIKE